MAPRLQLFIESACNTYDDHDEQQQISSCARRVEFKSISVLTSNFIFNSILILVFFERKKEEINDFRKTEMNKGSGGERLQLKMEKGNTERRT